MEVSTDDMKQVIKTLSILKYVLRGVHGELKTLEKKGLMIGKYPYYYGKPADTFDMFLEWADDHLDDLKTKFAIEDVKS